MHGYDHTISRDSRLHMEDPKHGFFLHDKGIGTEPNNDLTTLQNEFEKFNLHNTPITVIKLDVEGAEREVLPNWIESGILKNVKQIAIEFHEVNAESVGIYWSIVKGLLQQASTVYLFLQHECLRHF